MIVHEILFSHTKEIGLERIPGEPYLEIRPELGRARVWVRGLFAEAWDLYWPDSRMFFPKNQCCKRGPGCHFFTKARGGKKRLSI